LLYSKRDTARRDENEKLVSTRATGAMRNLLCL